MKARHKRLRNRHRLALAALIGVATFLVLNALRGNLFVFLLAHRVADGKAPPNHIPPVVLLVEAGSVTREEKAPDGQLRGHRHGESGHRRLQGILPDLFAEGQGVSPRAAWDRTMCSWPSEVLAKHDETYMPPEVASALESAGKMGQNVTRGEQAAMIPELRPDRPADRPGAVGHPGGIPADRRTTRHHLAWMQLALPAAARLQLLFVFTPSRC